MDPLENKSVLSEEDLASSNHMFGSSIDAHFTERRPREANTNQIKN